MVYHQTKPVMVLSLKLILTYKWLTFCILYYNTRKHFNIQKKYVTFAMLCAIVLDTFHE